MAAISSLFVNKKGDDVELNEDDIPGAKLPKPAELCTVSVLNRCCHVEELKLVEKEKISSQGKLSVRGGKLHISCSTTFDITFQKLSTGKLSLLYILSIKCHTLFLG